MTDEEIVVNCIRSQGWSEENLPSDEFRQMFDVCLEGIKIGSKLDRVWHDYDAGEDCYEDSHEGRWVKRENKQKWHDLRKDKKDLPDNNRCVWTNVGAGYYDGDGDGWWDDFGRLQDVIAWCEPKFEEE